MNLTSCRRAVAAATGRRFKSSRPDIDFDRRRMFYCYVLRFRKTGRRYVGSCENLTERIRRHNAGDTKSTKHGVPWSLVKRERFASRNEAAHLVRYYTT